VLGLLHEDAQLHDFLDRDHAIGRLITGRGGRHVVNRSVNRSVNGSVNKSVRAEAEGGDRLDGKELLAGFTRRSDPLRLTAAANPGRAQIRKRQAASAQNCQQARKKLMTVSEGLPDGMQRFFSDLQGEMRAWAPMLWSRLQLWWWVGGRKVGCSVGGVNKLSEANHHKPVNNHNSKYPHIALPAAAVGGCIPLVSTHEPSLDADACEHTANLH
jgi:hypothetical protein